MSDRWQQIEELYHAAREDRAVLDKADPELRREVESLLAQEKGAGFLEASALQMAAQQFAADRGQQMIGRRIGSYQVVSMLGAGGMGEVYRAKDTKLKREVALKVLPEAFAGDPERMARFQREAEALASMNHPNIAQIYGIEERALVMELVPGKTLKGPLPIETALNYAKQIADALEAAHEKGITHRDLKPSNIMITPAGVVKVLDFGLAAQSREHQEGGTLTMSLTRSGMIMGTAAYMSPEQARGEPVDKRADIWAFGVVFYEMLTGTPAFARDTTSDTLAAVLREEPEWNRAPQKAQRLLRRCLEKDPKRRLRDIADAMALVDDVGPAKTAPSRSRLGMIASAVAVVAVLVAIVGWWYATRPAPLRPLVRLNAEISADTPLAGAGGVVALSPDGTRLALILRDADGKVRLHTRLLEQNQATALAGTENAFSPFFSPDGEWIGFFADDKLKKISVQGGAAVTLCDAPDPDGASWGDDGNIVAALNGRAGGLWRVPSSGGTPVPLTKLNPGEVTHRWPQVLPGSQAVLFTASTVLGNYDEANIDAFSLRTGERKTVQHGGFFPRYLATSSGGGHLVYLHQSTLFAVPFNPGRLALAGVPAPILEDVSGGAGGGGLFAFGGAPSGPGTFVYLAATELGLPISWLDSAGKTQPLHAPPGFYYSLRFSPDGKRLAFALAGSTGVDIWVKDLDRDTTSRLSFLAGMNRLPVWTPDGKSIVFRSENSPAPGLYWIRADGSGETQRLSDGKLDEWPFSFSPDGKRLAFSANGNGGSPDIFTAPIEGDPGRGTLGVRLGKPELFLGTPFGEGHSMFSPDGRWLAYTSDESGTSEVYVRPFPGPGGRSQISKGGGLFPLWSRDGRELLFQTLDGRVMAVGYSAKGDSFDAGKPRVWSEARLLKVAGMPVYDLAPDGKRLAAMLASDPAGGEPTHLTFLLNFFDELRRRAPAGGK
jgi:Tol biopolymer transport system component/predicted Ser/Thr protein kinase